MDIALVGDSLVEGRTVHEEGNPGFLLAEVDHIQQVVLDNPGLVAAVDLVGDTLDSAKDIRDKSEEGQQVGNLVEAVAGKVTRLGMGVHGRASFLRVGPVAHLKIISGFTILDLVGNIFSVKTWMLSLRWNLLLLGRMWRLSRAS